MLLPVHLGVASQRLLHKAPSCNQHVQHCGVMLLLFAFGGLQCHQRVSRLQVDGCGRNLAKEKEYYRRYRVCKSHAGAQEVRCWDVAAGLLHMRCIACSPYADTTHLRCLAVLPQLLY